MQAFPHVRAMLATSISLAATSITTLAADPVLKLPAVTVTESRAEAFYIHGLENGTLRLWLRSLDAPCRKPHHPPSGRRGFGLLTAVRSHELRCGDEILRIAGQPVAPLNRETASRALLTSPAKTVVVEVRSQDTQQLRPATFRLHRTPSALLPPVAP